MVNSINDSHNFKQLDPEIKLKNSQQLHQNRNASGASNVSLSDVTKQIAMLKKYVTDTEVVNEARIEFIKSQIASGQYEMSGRQIAANMLNQMQSF